MYIPADAIADEHKDPRTIGEDIDDSEDASGVADQVAHPQRTWAGPTAFQVGGEAILRNQRNHVEIRVPIEQLDSLRCTRGTNEIAD
jgi:hypothetical protein